MEDPIFAKTKAAAERDEPTPPARPPTPSKARRVMSTSLSAPPLFHSASRFPSSTPASGWPTPDDFTPPSSTTGYARVITPLPPGMNPCVPTATIVSGDSGDCFASPSLGPPPTSFVPPSYSTPSFTAQSDNESTSSLHPVPSISSPPLEGSSSAHIQTSSSCPEDGRSDASTPYGLHVAGSSAATLAAVTAGSHRAQDEADSKKISFIF